MNGSATPSPATDDRTVIVFFPELWHLAFDTDGKEFWRVPLGSFGAIRRYGRPPVYDEGNVILLIFRSRRL